MPRGDGTGPPRGGMGGGKSGGMGRMGGNRPGAGPEGNCVCLVCGVTVTHHVGTPCIQMKCPKCGGPMTRR